MSHPSSDWTRRVRGDDCPVCHGTPETAPDWLVTMPAGRVHIQNDAAVRGYCILYFRRHATELYELTADERHLFLDDVNRLAAAIAVCCRPAKLNYAILGNEVPHLHCHIIPRYPDDGWWGRPIFLRPAGERRSLPSHEYKQLKTDLRAALAPPGLAMGGAG